MFSKIQTQTSNIQEFIVLWLRFIEDDYCEILWHEGQLCFTWQLLYQYNWHIQNIDTEDPSHRGNFPQILRSNYFVGALLSVVLLLLCVSQDDFTRWRQNWTWIYLQVSVCASCSQMVLFLPLLLFLLFLLFLRGEASSRHDGLGKQNRIRQQQLHQPGDCCVLRVWALLSALLQTKDWVSLPDVGDQQDQHRLREGCCSEHFIRGRNRI